MVFFRSSAALGRLVLDVLAILNGDVRLGVLVVLRVHVRVLPIWLGVRQVSSAWQVRVSRIPCAPIRVFLLVDPEFRALV